MLKVIELFAGIGSQTQALKNIRVEHEVVDVLEYIFTNLLIEESLR